MRFAGANTVTVNSISTGSSSIFSNEGDNYDLRIKEIEEYYVKTLLNEDEGVEEDYQNEEFVSSDTSSAPTLSPKQSFSYYQPLHDFKPAVPFIGGNHNVSVMKSKHNKNSLEVNINPNLDPSSDLLPLTTENLQRLSIAQVDPIVSHNNGPTIQKTTQSSQEQQPEINKELYKTELCESFTTKGSCKYGNKCQFAHGLHELKFKPRANNFRTKPCINWTKLGYCPYGKRCCFKHGNDQDIRLYSKASGSRAAEHEKSEIKKNLHANVKALQKITW